MKSKERSNLILDVLKNSTKIFSTVGNCLFLLFVPSFLLVFRLFSLNLLRVVYRETL